MFETATESGHLLPLARTPILMLTACPPIPLGKSIFLSAPALFLLGFERPCSHQCPLAETTLSGATQTIPTQSAELAQVQTPHNATSNTHAAWKNGMLGLQNLTHTTWMVQRKHEGEHQVAWVVGRFVPEADRATALSAYAQHHCTKCPVTHSR